MLEVKPRSPGEAAGPGHGSGRGHAHGRKAGAGPVPPEGVAIAEAARRTGVSAHTLRYYERAGLVVSPVVRARLAEIQENLEILDHKIDVYRGSLAAGEADRLWAPAR